MSGSFSVSREAAAWNLSRSWSLIPFLGIDYRLGVDGISLFVLLTGAILFPLVFLVVKHRTKGFYGNLLITAGAMAGAITASDMVLFYIFWEVMLLPVFFMIGLYGGPERKPATIKITALYRRRLAAHAGRDHLPRCRSLHPIR